MSNTLVHELFGVRYPIVQGGMTWVSRHTLAAAVSNAGALGVLGSGGMDPEEFREELAKLESLTRRPFAVNVPLVNVRPDGDEGVVPKLIQAALDSAAPVVCTGGGSPRRYTAQLKEAGKVVVHVVPSVALAFKAREAGVDAIVAESSEAGGHIKAGGLSTFSLLPQVADAIDLPVIAAGGIMDARGVLAALALGASGVQLGTRFIATRECNAHPAFKAALVDAGEDGSLIYSSSYHAGRALATPAVKAMLRMEQEGVCSADIVAFRGRGRAQQGCMEGNLEDGILPAGSGAGMVHCVQSVADVIEDLVLGFGQVLKRLEEDPRRVMQSGWDMRDSMAA